VGTAGRGVGGGNWSEGNGADVVRACRRGCDEESGVSWYADGVATEEFAGFGQERESADFWPGGPGGCEVLLGRKISRGNDEFWDMGEHIIILDGCLSGTPKV